MLCVAKGINLLPHVFHNASFAREERYQSTVSRYNRESSPTNFSFNFCSQVCAQLFVSVHFKSVLLE